MNLDPEIKQRAEQWLEPPFDHDTIEEIRDLFEKGDEDELYDRFYTDLDFGTGGMRGIMGAGLNRVNRYTIGRATQGLAQYLTANVQPPEGRRLSAVITHDSRHNSRAFARETASVLTGNGIRVFLFESLRPTPELSFAVRDLNATCGVVITASHNPKEYNGYKVYWSDGGQVVPPHDHGIIEEVNSIDDFCAIQREEYQRALDEEMITIIGDEVDEAYYKAILPLSIHPEVCKEQGSEMKIVYTPLHGTGITLAPEALRRWGFQHVILCESQSTPDGDFPNAPSPNPEEKEALSAAIDVAEQKSGDLVLATDPDADRVGIAVRHQDDFQLMTGNQIAPMLVEYVLGSKAKKGELPDNGAVVKTIVTTELIARIAEHYGVRLDNTLTGFKYIGEKIKKYKETGEATYLVGGEESYGYLIGTQARDKDAVVSSCFIAEMAAASRAKGQTLVDRMNDIYKRFGVYKESLKSIKFEGREGKEKIDGIMRSFRNDPPRRYAGSPVVEIRDYQEDVIKDAGSGEVKGKTGLPKSNVLMFWTEDGSQIVARPSGTEPKIKFYFSNSDLQDVPIKSDEQLEQIKKRLAQHHEQLRKDFLNHVHEISGK